MTGQPAWQPCNINEAKLPASMTYFWPAKAAQDIIRAVQGINKARIALFRKCHPFLVGSPVGLNLVQNTLNLGPDVMR